MNLIEQAKKQAAEAVLGAYHAAVAAGELPEGDVPAVAVEIPKDTKNGDYASSFAMQCARALHMAPRKIAEALVAHIALDGTYFEEISIAGPGFLNFRLGKKWYADAVQLVSDMGADYGRIKAEHPEKIMVEFVSANPTGPMHMGNARGGVLGDCLSEVLDWAGHDVTREFYINDAGNQVDKFAHSVEGRYIQQLKGEDAIVYLTRAGIRVRTSASWQLIWSRSTVTSCSTWTARSAAKSSSNTACRPTSRACSAIWSAIKFTMMCGSVRAACMTPASSRRLLIC